MSPTYKIKQILRNEMKYIFYNSAVFFDYV